MGMTNISAALGRYKAAHWAAILGDIAMMATGVAGMLGWVASAGIGDITFVLGGLSALAGHVALMRKVSAMPAGRRLAPFILAGVFYAVSGIALSNYTFVVAGLLVSGAAILGWLVPRGGNIGGSSKMQAISGILVISTLLTYTAAVQCDNPVLFAAAVFFTICNIADYFVRRSFPHVD